MMNAAKPDFPKDGFAIRLYISECLSSTLWLGDFVAGKEIKIIFILIDHDFSLCESANHQLSRYIGTGNNQFKSPSPIVLKLYL